MPEDRFAAAKAAFSAGKIREGAELLAAELTADGAAPLLSYRHLAAAFFRLKVYDQAEHWARAGLARFPRDAELMNLLGVALRRSGKRAEAVEVLQQAIRLEPKNLALVSNLGNVFNDMKDPRALDTFGKLVRLKPSDGEFQRQLGRAHWFAGDLQKAEMRLNLATKLQPQVIDGWLDLLAISIDLRSLDDSFAVLERAVEAMPDERRLMEARVNMLRRAGRLRDADAFLQDLLKQRPDDAWVHFQLGGVVSDYDRPRANTHLRRAVELAPDDLASRLSLAESLGRSRHGDEGAHLEEAYNVLHQALERHGVTAKDLDSGPLKVATEIMGRVAAYDDLEHLGTFDELGRKWAEAGRHTAFLAHLARVRSDQDRHDLLEHHRIWGRALARAVQARPLRRPGPRAPTGKIRLGFMSSDLRAHPVAFFSMPLFQHYDRERFEVYCYSYFQGEADKMQDRIAGWVDAFRWEQEINDYEAAQMIADDQLDMLIELGGSTHMNKLSVMGFKPAPLQASWLGYPHSAGAAEIDYLILDPHVAPVSRDLLVEEPLLMPKSWIAMGELAFPERPITPGTPQERNGFLTFGTANNPYKYSREMLQTWARAVAAVPNSQFLFVRPECGAPTFRRNIARIFESQGVSAERIRFEAIRGHHMPFYNEIDISLDSFPQTGGTTTCEALWMGVPVVTIAGKAMFERLSHSILTNAGLADLSTGSPEEMIDVALKLAADHERRKRLRVELRETLKASPLGQTRQFATDFYAMIERAVTERGLVAA